MLHRKLEVVEWDRRLREDEARRKAEHNDASYVADHHGDEYREWFDPKTGTRVVTWVAHMPYGFLIDTTDEASHSLGYRSPHSARDAAGRVSLDGDSLNGEYVPAPHPKARKPKRPRPVAMAYPDLLRFAFYARCYARLGYVGIKSGKGNKSPAETDLLRRFLCDYHAQGWPQSYLVAATGRSKANVALHISTERAEVARLLDLLIPPVLPWDPRATESNLKWCDGACPRYADEGTKRVYTAPDGEHVEYVVSSTWTWKDHEYDRKHEALRCSHCHGLISKLSADLDQRRNSAAGRDSSLGPRALLLPSPDVTTRSEIRV